MGVAEVIDAHRRAGRTFNASGVTSFVREEGSGPAVVCVHGMWGSSFLYRKVLRELAARGLRGVAWDLPGFGLAERPPGFDYRWSGLGRFAIAAADALGLDRFHLLLHDVGGPVGLELAAGRPERVASLTLLNTVVDVTGFSPPWSMKPFRRRGLGELWMAGLSPAPFRALLRLQGIEDTSGIPDVELDAYLALAKGSDGGRAFLRVARGSEGTQAKQALYQSVVSALRPNVQVVWGAGDPAMRLGKHGEAARAAAGVDAIHAIPGRHFPQEDQAPAIARHVAALVAVVEQSRAPTPA